MLWCSGTAWCVQSLREEVSEPFGDPWTIGGRRAGKGEGSVFNEEHGTNRLHASHCPDHFA